MVSSCTFLPRMMISAASSGAGKTSWTLGLLRAFSAEGLSVQAFKSGPDYIDPALHSLLTPFPSRNLDTRLLGRAAVRSIFAANAARADLALVEGAMGYYDGAGPGEEAGSAYRLACWIDAPVFIVLDARAAGASAAATALGFLKFKRRSRIAGFLVNRIGSERHLETVRAAVEAATGLPVFGSLPKDGSLILPERHLGLVSGDENADFMRVVERIAAAVSSRCDLKGMLAAARNAPPLPYSRSPECSASAGNTALEKPVRIAVARDRAFSFYYEDNLDRLRSLGAELAFFSPLGSASLPEGCRGLYLGGGYPEVYAGLLSENVRLREEIRSAALAGMPVLAECGGYMYLAEAIADGRGAEYPMVGLFRGKAAMGRGRAALGYYEGEVLAETPFARKGARLRGHCFHWSSMIRPEGSRPVLSLSKDAESAIPDGEALKATFASYLHIHFATHPGFARNFVRACRRFTAGGNP